MALLTTSEVKTLLQMSEDDISKDSFIELNIPIIEDFIKTYCKDDYVDGFPVGLKQVGAQMINYNMQKPTANLDSEKIGDSYQVTFNKEYPQYILKQLSVYAKIRIL